MCLVRCLTDKRHKLFGSNKCSDFFSFSSLRSARGWFFFIFRQRDETRYICRRWRALTHSLYNPIFFYLEEKLHLLLAFFCTQFPQFFSFFASRYAKPVALSLQKTLSEQSFHTVFFSFVLRYFESHTKFTIIQSTFRI